MFEEMTNFASSFAPMPVTTSAASVALDGGEGTSIPVDPSLGVSPQPTASVDSNSIDWSQLF